MVLKKSNSRLNTGATQRHASERDVLRLPSNMSISDPGTVTVFLTGHEDSSTQSWAIFNEGLNTIYECLDLQGPDLSAFYDTDGLTKPQYGFNEFSFTKHQTDSSMSLTKNVKKMIDDKVLEPMTNVLAIEIMIFKRCPVQRYKSKIHVFEWKSTEKRAKPSNTKEDRKLRRKKNNPNTHIRGIQRRNRVSLDEAIEEENVMNLPWRKISIEIEEPYAVDARLFGKPLYSSKNKYSEHVGKSCWKVKGFVNGGKSDFNGYNYTSIIEDETEALLEAAEEEDGFWHGNFTYSDDDVDMESDDGVEYCLSERGLCLSDYLAPNRNEANREMFEASQSKLVCINSASSEKVMRHPKGSCIFLKATSVDNDSDEDIDSGFEGNLSFKSNSTDSLDDQNQEGQTVENIMDSENFEFDLIAKIDEFISKFIEIHLILPSDLMDKSASSTPCADQFFSEEEDCCVFWGNCYPPTFLVKMNANDEDNPDKNSWYLTGKAIEMNTRNNSQKWRVQVGKINEPESEIVDIVMNTLQKTIVSEVTLKDLIQVLKKSLAFDIPTDCQSKPASKPLSHLLPSHRKGSAWCELARFVPTYAQTVPLMKALYLNNSTNRRQVSQSGCPFQNVNKSSTSTTILCDICFLPCDFSQSEHSEALALHTCGHVFCLHCWSSHVFLSLRNANPIRCMESDCKQELNESLLRSLAPGHMVNKWHQRLQDKAIEQSPLSKWCPNTKCDMVGVLPQLSSQDIQFGNLILCECQGHWCFSCQAEPHWPASCEQAAAFRRLLAKTGNDLEIPTSRVGYTIQLKRCPKCHYPIEKNEGCPSMVCRMCWFNFCWNCLRPVDHSVYSCKAREDNYDTFNLQNKLVHELPLKFFPDYLKMNRKRQNMKSVRISSWLKKLQLYKSEQYKMSLSFSLEMSTKEEAKSRVIEIAETTVSFLIQVYTLLESFYGLLSFVNMIKDKPRKIINSILNGFLHPTQTLHFIICRLEDQVISKSVSPIFKYASTADMLMKCGEKHMKTIARNVDILQSLTKDVDASRISDIDPMKFLRYK